MNSAQTLAHRVADTLTETKAPRVTVLVPCRNERDHIEDFLEDLLAQESVEGGIEILILDGMSDDGTTEILRSFGEKHHEVITVPNEGRIVSTGLNAGIRAARGEIIVRMDVHTRYAEDYLRQSVEVLQETGAANAGGAARTDATGYWPRAIAAAYASPFAVGGARFHFADYEGEVDTVTYGCWHRQTLIDLGGFDEDLVRNQDDELNLRTRRAGLRVWQSPRIRSWYRPRADLRLLFRQYFQYGFWKVAVLRKHRIPASWRHLVPITFLLSVLMLSIAAPYIPGAGLLLALDLGAWLSFLLVGSIWIARRRGWDLLPVLPLTIAVFHVSYASGMLRGFFSFRQNEPSGATAALTR